ncbi:AI-2E family transporter [Agathobaculum sp. Marseille-P7918]|uniref:AI-2E family transporter n=1 Tax=Agathobaculum sp. Marseille-P7918 TaxID=2479843 RepID=UPI000F636876|nr:AI-2E family transporter [Agathobaculum sp. Marseille-P7918]
MNLNRDTMKKIMGLIAFGILLYVGLQNTRMVSAALRYLAGLTAPFLIGGCIAFILNVPMRFFEQKIFANSKAKSSKRMRKMQRVFSLLLTLAVVLGVIVIVLFMVAPELYSSFAAIGREMTSFGRRLPQILEEAGERLPMFADEIRKIEADLLDVNWKEIGQMAKDFLQNSNFLSSTVDIATSVVSGVTNTIIGLVFAIYILLQKENLGRQFRRLFYAVFPEKHVDRFLEVCNLTSASFNSFLSGQCLEAFILGMMFFISMSALQMPYALVIAVLIGVTALIPIFGAFIGCIVGAFLILIASPMQALWFIVLFLVLQQIEGNVIYPRVVGGSVGLPSIWVLVAVTLGASVAGVLGILFAIPVVSVVYTLLREYVRDSIRERGIAENKIQ